MQAPSAALQPQQENGPAVGQSQASSHEQAAAEQAGSLTGVQKLKTKGDSDETAVPLSSSRAHSYTTEVWFTHVWFTC